MFNKLSYRLYDLPELAKSATGHQDYVRTSGWRAPLDIMLCGATEFAMDVLSPKNRISSHAKRGRAPDR